MRIRPLEALLGFKFANGVSRSKGLRQDPILSELLSGFDFINEEYKAYNTKQVHTSVEIKLEADRLFDRLGPSLWPGPTEPRPNWLLRPSGYNEHPFAHLYSRDLFFSNPDDRKT